VKKKNSLLLITIIFIGTLNLFPHVKAIDYGILFFDIDKTNYYTDDKINIRFSGILDYEPNPPLIDAFFQIYIVNSPDSTPIDSNSVIWCSPEYHKSGLISENISINVFNLNFEFSNENVSLYVKIRYFYFNYYNQEENQDIFLESYTKKINILKKGTTFLEIYYLKTDKKDYYKGESILLNASWKLNYRPNPPDIDAFIQIYLLNDSNHVIWNSIPYHENITINISQVLNITELNPFLAEEINTFYLKFRLFYYFHENDTDDLFLENYTYSFKIMVNLNACTIINYLNTNKETYYFGENIIINFSYTFDNYTFISDAYLQICLINQASEKILWNSTKFYEKTMINKQLIIPTFQLNFTLINEFSELHLKILYFYYYNSSYYDFIFFENFTRRIFISKGILSHKLIDFKSSLKYGENQEFQIKFYNYFCGEPIFLKEQEINCLIYFNNFLIKKKTYFLNEKGEVSMDLSYRELSIGKNFLVFNLTRIKNHKNYIFNQTLTLEKLDVKMEVKYLYIINKKIIYGDIKFFYIQAENTLFLIHKKITVSLWNFTDLFLETQYLTDKNGQLSFSIFLNHSLNTDGEIYLKCKWDGNETLKQFEETIKIQNEQIFETQQEGNPHPNAPFLINIFSLISILSIFILILTIIIKKNKNSGEILLEKYEFKN